MMTKATALLRTSTLALMAALAIPGEASASTDTLILQFDVDSGYTVDRALVWLEKVVFYGCGGPIVTETVEEAVDLDAGFSVDLPTTTFCQVNLHFNTDILVDGANANTSAPFTSLSPIRQVQMSLSTGQTLELDLTGTKALEGIYGGNPQLHVTRDD